MRFRSYHRINEFALKVPPVGERNDDMLVFANSFLEEANKELDKSVEKFSSDVETILSNHHWSGNLRQMRNVVKRAVLFATGKVVEAEDLP